MPLLRSDPDDRSVLAAAIAVHFAAQRLTQALHFSERAIALYPDSADPLFNHGCLLVRMNRVREGVEFLTRSCSIDPSDADRWVELAHAHLTLDHLDECEQALLNALAAHPSHRRARVLLANHYGLLGESERSTAIFRELQREDPNDYTIAQSICLGLNSNPSATPAAALAAAKAYGRLIELLNDQPRLPARPRHPGKRPLLLSIVTHEAGRHSVSHFLEPILRHLPRAAFHVWLIHTGPHADDRTHALAALADRFDHLPRIASPDLARRIHTAGTDILLETSGMTNGHRLHAVLQRPASLHVTAIGYPATTGVPGMDLRLVDHITDPPEHDGHLTETPLRLNRCFLCFSPSPESLAVAVQPGPSQRGEPFTFGSFNQSWKINSVIASRWAAILAAAPGSRLLIKAKAMVQSRARQGLLDGLAAAGVSADRVEILPWTASGADHLNLYSRVDLALDPWPYNGTTTVCEAMLMGVPTLGMLGDRHVCRVTASLNAAVGLSEFTAPDPTEYTRRAVALAADPTPLHTLRTTLRPRLLASPLCDGPAYGRALGDALTAAYDRTQPLSPPP
jgi:protein O-GlcNAc transferase